MNAAIQAAARIRAETDRAASIVLLDRNEADRQRTAVLLDGHGFQVLPAASGDEAVRLYREAGPDLVILDVSAPDAVGFDVAARIRDLADGRHVPIVFLVGASDAALLDRCVEADCDDFLVKPVNPALVRARIELMLRTATINRVLTEQRDELSYHQQQQEKELVVAERIHKNLVERPSLRAENLRYLVLPMSMFSGDMVAATAVPSGAQLVLVGDFTGHGLPAAIGAMTAADVFYGMAGKGFSLGEIILELNRKLGTVLPAEMFLSACLVELRPESGTAVIWNAGLPPVLICDSDGNIGQRVVSSHLPLGIIANDDIDRQGVTVRLAPGDRLYIHSDGVVEARNESGEMYGDGRLEDSILGSGGRDTSFDLVTRALHEFRGEVAQQDDITLVELTCDPALRIDVDGVAARRATKEAGRWRLRFEMCADTLKSTEPLPLLTQMITEVQGLGAEREHIYTILAELFSNAVEHGLLGLDSGLKHSPEGFAEYYRQRELRLSELEVGRIAFDIGHAPTGTGGRLTCVIEHDGAGYREGEACDDLAGNTRLHGRGIPLVRSLCREMRYSDDGRRVEVVYEWENVGHPS